MPTQEEMIKALRGQATEVAPDQNAMVEALRNAASDVSRKAMEHIPTAREVGEAKLFEEQTPAQRARTKYAREEINPIEAFGMGAIEESRKLFGVGGKSIINALDFGQEFYSSMITGDKEGVDQAVKDIADLKLSNAERTKIMKEFKAEHPVANVLGGMTPYMMDSFLLGPKAASLAGRGLDKITDITEGIGTVARGKFATTIDKIAELPGPMGDAGKRILRESVEPRIREAAGKKKRFKRKSPFFEGALSRMAGDITMGTIEGTLHPEMTAGEGAIASGFGSAIGHGISPAVSRHPMMWDESNLETMRKMEDIGVTSSPSMKVGSQNLHIKEQGFRSSGKYADEMQTYDNANQQAFNAEAYDVMGMGQGRGKISAEELDAHMRSMGDEYEALSRSTTGIFDKNDFTEMEQILAELSRSSGKSSKHLAGKYRSYLKELKGIRTFDKDIHGKYIAETFDGSEYQRVREVISREMDNETGQYAGAMRRLLAPMREKLDNAVERGLKREDITMQRPPGKSGAAAWRDLNERYAMSKTVMENGMDFNRDINLDKLSNYFERTDTSRVLRGQGGRIKRLHEMAKYNNMNKKLRGNANNTGGLVSEEKGQTLTESALSLPSKLVPRAMERFALGKYMSGKPSLTGLLNMKPAGHMYNAPLVLRAAEMSGQFHPSIMNMGMKAGETVKDIYDYSTDFLMGAPEGQ